jgi:hypothetical protein
MFKQSSTGLGIRDGGNTSKGFQCSVEFLQSFIQRVHIHWRQMDEFYSLGLNLQLFQPEPRIIGSFVRTSRSFQILASFFRACEHKHALRASGKRFENVMSLHLS